MGGQTAICSHNPALLSFKEAGDSGTCHSPNGGHLPREARQTQNDEQSVMPLARSLEESNSWRQKGAPAGCRVRGEGKGELLVNGDSLLCQVRRVLEALLVMVA